MSPKGPGKIGEEASARGRGPANAHSCYRFDEFTIDLACASVFRDGRDVRLRPKSYDALKYFIENRGRLVTKEELIGALWPDSFVTDDSLVKCVSDVRLALDDDAHRYIKTVSRRGYVFDAEVVGPETDGRAIGTPAPVSAGLAIDEHTAELPEGLAQPASRFVGRTLPRKPHRVLAAFALIVAMTLGAVLIVAFAHRAATGRGAVPRDLVRLTFDSGLQGEPTWSPDGRLVAFSSDVGGNLDIWVQSVGGGTPVRLTRSLAHDSQPDWSPDGNQIVFRSERDGGGLYLVPALGGVERRICPFGFRPRWSPDAARILFAGSAARNVIVPPRWYVAVVGGGPPQEILPEFAASFTTVRAMWHPDGRVSFWGEHRREGRSFWTAPLTGSPPVRSDVAAPVAEQLARLDAPDLQEFAWSPTADAIYFEGVSRGVRNLWRIAVDPRTLRWVLGPERLTIGPGPDGDASPSHDGTKVAYAARHAHTRIWSFPFDTATGTMKDDGEPLTPPELSVVDGEISPDAKTLVFVANRAGKAELWTKSLEDGSEQILAADGLARGFPRWSGDSRRLAYLRGRLAGHGSAEFSLVLRSAGGGDEEELTSPHKTIELASDWSEDGQWIVASSDRGTPGRFRICAFPVALAPRAETGMRVLASHARQDLWHARLSPDGRWLSFHAVSTGGPASVYVVRREGGAWVPIAGGPHWNGKARWSPDGKVIFFLSNRTGFFEVWKIRFDPDAGRPVGEPLLVSRLETPGRRIPGPEAPPSLSFAGGRIMLPVTESSGSIWMLETNHR